MAMSSFVTIQPEKLDMTAFEFSERVSDVHNSAQKGNFDGAAAKLPELDLEDDLENEKQIFEHLSRPEKYAKRSCPICGVHNDGQCCHFVQEHGSLPALKVCIKCGKVGEHRSWECPNIASQSDPVINDKHPAPESEVEGEAANFPHQNQNQRAQLRRPAPESESESEGAAAKLPELDLEDDLENEKQIFEHLSRPEKYAKRSCPICGVHNDGQCCHFVQEHGSIPTLKVCIKCGKVGEHRSWECPNIASQSDPVINDKHPAPESEVKGEAANFPHQNQNQRAQLRRPAPESESEGAAAKRPALESIKNQRRAQLLAPTRVPECDETKAF